MWLVLFTFLYHGLETVVNCHVQLLNCPFGCQCKEYNYNISVELNHHVGIMAICDASVNDNGVRELFNGLHQSVVSLTLHSSNLVDLTDLCCLRNIKELDLSYNTIADSASYFQYPSVQVLRLTHNSFSALRKNEFISFANVNILELDENVIEHIDVEALNLQYLKELSLRSNRISFISETLFRFLPKLEKLNLANNLLYSVGPRNFYYILSLKWLDLSNNNIKTVDDKAFVPLKHLSDLNLADNDLKEVPSNALRSFRWEMLTFDGNPFSDLSMGVFANVSVKSLSLNRIFNFVAIAREAFVGIEKLQWLSVSQCHSLQYFSLLWLKDNDEKTTISITQNNISVLPLTFANVSNVRIDISENPIDCECINKFEREKLLESKYSCGNISKHRQEKCNEPIFLPDAPTDVERFIGDSVRMYCIISWNSTIVNPVWVLPNGRRISTDQPMSRFYISTEMLSIDQLQHSDSGVYLCVVANETTGGKYKKERRIILKVKAPNIRIYVVEVTWQSITISWNGSKHDLSGGEVFLQYTSTRTNNTFTAALPKYNNVYTISRLKENNNYTICIVYKRDDVEYFNYCIGVETKTYHPGLGTKFSYGFFYLLVATFLLIILFCVIRFLQRRLYILEEEKCRAKVQQSVSGESFFQSEPTTPVGITYENALAVQDYSQSPMEPCSSSQTRGMAMLEIRHGNSEISEHSTTIASNSSTL